MFRWKGLSACNGDLVVITVECLYGYSWHGGNIKIGNIIIFCLEKYLEVTGIRDHFDEKKIIGPNVVNSVVEGSIINSKAKVLRIL